jgi:hypothetical protein
LKYKRERMLFIPCAAGGLRIGEALGLEIDKHISADFRTLDISQKVLLHSKVYKRLKTASAARPCIVPVPCVYSRLISSNSSTLRSPVHRSPCRLRRQGDRLVSEGGPIQSSEITGKP